jgi:perosamine synthetase
MAAYDSGWISSLGEFLELTAESLSRKLNLEHVALTSNGTTALHLALLALDIGSGDEVLVQDLSYVAVPNAVQYVGAKPILVDVEPQTLGFNLQQLENSIGPRTKAIILVHNYGFVSDVSKVAAFARERGIYLIEDCAEASFHVTSLGMTGTFGDLSIYSFFGNKLITSGEGGAVASNNGPLIERVNYLKNQGAIQGRRFEFDEVGYNFRMTNLQAALLLGQLERLPEFIAARARVFSVYEDSFKDQPFVDQGLYVSHNGVSPWMYSLRLVDELGIQERDFIIASLAQVGIESRPYFQPHSVSKRFEHEFKSFPTSTSVSTRSLNLPTFSHMTDEQIELVVREVKYALGQFSIRS